MVILLPHPLKYGEAYYLYALVLPKRKKKLRIAWKEVHE